jgi:hypothetical protein
MKEFIGTCVENPFGSVDRLCEIIDKAKNVSRKAFFTVCDLSEDEKRIMRQYPNDFRFFCNGAIFFYEWSRIEYFYK